MPKLHFRRVIARFKLDFFQTAGITSLTPASGRRTRRVPSLSRAAVSQIAAGTHARARAEMNEEQRLNTNDQLSVCSGRVISSPDELSSYFILLSLFAKLFALNMHVIS